MVQTTPSSSSNIQADIQGEISGQVVVGNHNVQIHAEHGALVNVISGDRLPAPRPRATPVLSLRPRPFRGLLDRQSEITSITSALLTEAPVEIHGEAGIGKTAVLRNLAYQSEVDRFSSGVVYRSTGREAPADLLQFLFDAFYECDVPFKPTDTQVRHFLRDKQALVLLDDVELGREALEQLMDAVPSIAFVVASAERRLWGEVSSIAVRGLPDEDAISLVERELGRTLTSEEREAALALCAAVGSNPLRILQEVAAAREERRPLVAASQSVQAAPAPERVTEQALASLSESQRSILGILAAFGGASAGDKHLAALSGLPDAGRIVQTLEQRNLVQTEGSRRRLTGNLASVLEKEWDLRPRRESALTYFITWAEQPQTSPDSLLEEIDCLRELLNWAGATGRWKEAQRLGRAMEGALTVSGRWEAWRSVVQSVLQASRALGDEAGTGWAFHQLGTRALCLSDDSDAGNFLRQALEIRESLGDAAGAAVTRHNLEILIGPPTPVDDAGSSASGAGSSMRVPLLLKVAGSALLVGLGAWVLWRVVAGGSILPPEALSASVSSPSNVAVSWVDKSADETEFRIERKKGEGGFAEVARAPANATSFQDSDLEANSRYTYRLRAAGPRGQSGYSNEIAVLTHPAAPSDLSLREVSPAEIQLTWTDRNPNAAASRIERSIDSGATFSQLSTTPAGTTSYSDTPSLEHRTLYYRVCAKNDWGDSGYSNLVVWSVLPRPPAAPRLIEARGTSSSEIALRWTDGSDNETGFKIERKSGNTSYRQIALVEANASGFADGGLTADTSYSYRIRGTNGAGDSPYTNEVSATTLLDPPKPPSGLTASPTAGSGVDLTWRDNSENETGFHIERKTGGDSYQRIKTTAAGAVKFNESALRPQTNYTYRVQAFNRAGGSAFSNDVSITTPALPGRIEVSPLRVRFGSLTVGSTATAQVRIINTGRGTLSGGVAGAGAPFKVLLSQESFSLSPAKPLVVTVEFSPVEPGDFTGTLTIKSNDPQRPELQVGLMGSAKRPPAAVELNSLNLAVPEVIGGNPSEGKVVLSNVAPERGTAIALSSDSEVVRVQKSVVVRSGEATAVFTIRTDKVLKNTQATISASLGNDRRTAVLKVSARQEPQQPHQPEVKLESLSLAAAVVTGGESSQGKVTLSGAAPDRGAVINLSSNNRVVQVPANLTIRGGEAGAVFTIKTSKVAGNTRAIVSASLGQERRTAVLEVRANAEPPQTAVSLESLTIRPARVKGGQRSIGTVKLSGVAPRDMEVAIFNDKPRVATVPRTAIVRRGSASGTFVIATELRPRSGRVVGGNQGVAQSEEIVTISVSLAGKGSKATLTVW